MTIPEDRRYTDQHEWALMVDGKVRIGITDYAQDALGDVVFVDLPAIGRRVGAGRRSQRWSPRNPWPRSTPRVPGRSLRSIPPSPTPPVGSTPIRMARGGSWS